jgi:hypothetical protein
MVLLLTTEKKKVSLYLDDALKTRVTKLAAAERRSLNNLIEVLLQDAVDKAVKEGKIND